MLNKDKKHPFRRLVLFQLKLAMDALRDILLSPISIICSILDLVLKNKKSISYFDQLMSFGRHTDTKINLFEQHRDEEVTIDSLLGQLEGVILKEHKDKEFSKKTLASIKKLVKKDKKKSLLE
jgi:hypothetical protein